MMSSESKELSPEGARIVFYVMIGLLILSVLLFAYNNYERSRYQKHATRVQGKVIRNSPTSNGGTGYQVTVEYKDHNDIPRSFRARVPLIGTRARVGAKVTVRYFPKESRSAVIQEWVDDSLSRYVPLAFVLGLLFFCGLIGSGISKRDGFAFLIFQK